MSDFIAYLFAMLVMTPLQAEVSQRLQSTQAQALVTAGQHCVSAEMPRLLRQAQDDWGWAAAQAVGIGFGMVDPVSILSEENEHCARVVNALRGGETDSDA